MNTQSVQITTGNGKLLQHLCESIARINMGQEYIKYEQSA